MRGHDEREVTPEHTRKSVGAERTFSTDYKDWEIILEELKTIAEKVSERMKRIETKGKTITVKVRYDDFETISRSQTASEYYHDESQIFLLAKQLLEETQAGERKVRLLGISMSNLDNEPERSELIQLKLPFPS